MDEQLDSIQSTSITDAQLRSWLALLRRPDRLAGSELANLLVDRGHLSPDLPAREVAAAAADVLLRSIEHLAPGEDRTREKRLPYVVLRTCFVDGDKLFQAANKLGMSERQLSRERAWAIGLLRTELESELQRRPAPHAPYRPEPIPAIDEYLPRPALIAELHELLAERRIVVVAGPAGIGKTSLVAELASQAEKSAAVLWYRFRPGLNDSASAVLLEVADLLDSEGSPELSTFISGQQGSFDMAAAIRLALRGLDSRDRLLVFDDFHISEDDRQLAGLIEELVTRLPQLRALLLSRRQDAPLMQAPSYAVQTFSRNETDDLLRKLGAEASEAIVDALHEWTRGVPHLISLAAAWLKTASSNEIQAGIAALTNHAQVQAFLLGTITDLLDPDDRAILDAASIFRGPFTDDGLAVVSGRSRGSVLDASHRLVRAHAATRSRDGSCAFFHTTVREFVYERLTDDQRALLHPRAAAWFEQVGNAEEARYHRGQAKAARRT